MTVITRNRERQSRKNRFLPILHWLPGYKRAWLRGDLLAGLTVLALLIPEGMAYAEIAGMPPQTAFYAAPIGLILYAVFGTSKQLVVAVSAVIATMSAAAIAPLAAAGSPEYAALTAGLAILAGLIAVLAGLFKLGRIANFFSESVLAGFVTGLALTVAIKQVPKILGIEGGSGNFWERTFHILTHLDERHALTLIVGLLSLVLLFGMEHYFHKLPAALTVIVALFFTPFFAPLPEAVLGAVVIVAITGMIKIKTIRRLYRLNQTDFVLAIVAMLGVLTFEALEGLVIAVILSLLVLVWRASQAHMSVLGREPGRILFSDSRRHPENQTLPGLLILRPDEGLFFANVDTLRNDILHLVDAAQPPVKVLLLDLEMSNQLDVPAVDMLVELKGELGQRNVGLWLSRLHGPAQDSLRLSGVLQQVGPQNIYPRTLDSSLEYLSRGTFEGGEDVSVVRDGLKMTLAVIEKLLADPDAGRRKVLESYHRELTAILATSEIKSH